MASVKFFINGKKFKVDASSVHENSRLVDFIRNDANLKGTKWMCREGGCGACVVNLREKDSKTGEETCKAVNSCLVPLLSCEGMDILTVEALGNVREGLHPIQKRLVEFGASQCGFCTPGMVMSMHGLMQGGMGNNGGVKCGDVENALDGNICRCTGYRGILDSFKSLCKDADPELKGRCKEIEDCGKCPCPRVVPSVSTCPNPGGPCCKQACMENAKMRSGQEWSRPDSLPKALDLLHLHTRAGRRVRLVGGNTGTGVFPHEDTNHAYIDLGGIKELKQWTGDSTGITIGAAVTITEAVKIFRDAEEKWRFVAGEKVAKHLERVANVPVRNRGTLAGNLMMKHVHRDFPSDIFLLMETLGAQIRIASSDKSTPKIHSVMEFLKLDMRGKIILAIFIPLRDATSGWYFRSFKITRRWQNAHAYVNAAFLLKIDPSSKRVTEVPRICFGGINDQFIHASKCERFLDGKTVTDKSVLSDAMKCLDEEINPDVKPLDGSPQYRKQLTKSLLYKVLLEIAGNSLKDAKVKTGAMCMERKEKKGLRDLGAVRQGHEKTLYGPVKKLEAPAQATGEAEYINDIPQRPNELFAAFVLSSIGKGTLAGVDASAALKVPEVEAFIDVNDIPNQSGNHSMAFGFMPGLQQEPIFVSKDISYAGQAIGLVVASSMEAAFAAAKLVKVLYSDMDEKPVADVSEAYDKVVAAGLLQQHTGMVIKSTDEGPGPIVHDVKGEFKIGQQAHFAMEPHSCLCIPQEDRIEVFPGTQWMDHVQTCVASALGIQNNAVHVKVERVGGAFGGKISKTTGVAGACAVAAWKLRRPVRLIVDIESYMRMLGKRAPYICRYNIGFDNDGKIGKMHVEFVSDLGYTFNEPIWALMQNNMQGPYKAVNWEVTIRFVGTNTASNTWMRAPGVVKSVAFMETVIDHVAHVLKKDPYEIRLANAAAVGDAVFPPTLSKAFEDTLGIEIMNDLVKSAKYKERHAEIERFNRENRWKKKGISIVPVRYHTDYFFTKYTVFVTISHHDGTVSVSHGGIEIGNGVNTKVAQTVAFALGIDVDLVRVRASNNFTANNASLTGGSITSESCCHAAMEACKVLKGRMEGVKKEEGQDWIEFVKASAAAHLDLSASYMVGPNDKIEEYFIWVVCVTEVDMDVLTGEYKVNRVDLVEETGSSLNPMVDIGQIEGAYIMGLGMWTMENSIKDPQSGDVLTTRTWTYKVPECKDIPEDFRVTLLNSKSNTAGVLGNKAVGEPPVCAAIGIVLALRQAITSARNDVGEESWFNLDGPVTQEDVLRHCLTNSQHFNF